MVSSIICAIAQWFAALLSRTCLCIPEKAVSALLPCLGDSCRERCQQQVRARRSGTLPYSHGMEKKCTKLIKAPTVLTRKKCFGYTGFQEPRRSEVPKPQWVLPSQTWCLLAQGKSAWTSEHRELWPLLSPQEYPSQFPELFHCLFLNNDTSLKPQKSGGSFCRLPGF